MGRNKGGRPPLDEGKRVFKIDVRFTEAEYRQIGEMEQALGLKKTELVRKRVLGESLATVVNAKALLSALFSLNSDPRIKRKMTVAVCLCFVGPDQDREAL